MFAAYCFLVAALWVSCCLLIAGRSLLLGASSQILFTAALFGASRRCFGKGTYPPMALSAEQVARISSMKRKNKSIAEIAEKLDCSVRTILNYLSSDYQPAILKKREVNLQAGSSVGR